MCRAVSYLAISLSFLYPALPRESGTNKLTFPKVPFLLLNFLSYVDLTEQRDRSDTSRARHTATPPLDDTGPSKSPNETPPLA